MWQAPSRSKTRKRTALKRKPMFHLKRVSAEVKVLPPKGQLSTPDQNPPQTARVILNDITERGMGLFLPESIQVGDSVGITLEEPKRVFVRGKVINCQESGTRSAVLTEVIYAYRVVVEFEFQSEEEQNAIMDFCRELSGDILNAEGATEEKAAA